MDLLNLLDYASFLFLWPALYLCTFESLGGIILRAIICAKSPLLLNTTELHETLFLVVRGHLRRV